MNANDIYDQVFERYAPEYQLRMLQEECSELAAAINHHLRGRISVRDLCAEIADVEILLEQVRGYIYPGHVIDDEKNFKLQRLETILKKQGDK